MEKSVSLRADAGTRTVSLTVLEDDQTMQHLGENETFVKIQPGTAAVTYKLTKTLKLSIGDTIRLYLPGDDEPLSLVIGPDQCFSGRLSRPNDMGILPQGGFHPDRPPAQESVGRLPDAARRYG